jgi:hypothetical protein
VAYVAEAIGQPDARKVIAKTVATNLAYMARRHKTVAKIGERAAARWPLFGIRKRTVYSPETLIAKLIPWRRSPEVLELIGFAGDAFEEANATAARLAQLPQQSS